MTMKPKIVHLPAPLAKRSGWRTALGLTTTTLNYKDHDGNNQTLTVVILGA